jgi:erythronate-4-phosphate dehydrogenase
MGLKIVIDSDIPFIRGVLEEHAVVAYHPGPAIRRDTLLDADALVVRTRTRCDRSLLEGTRVRFVGSATIGYDHIDTDYCRSAGIAWTNAPGCNSSSVQQYVAAALFTLRGRFRDDLSGLTIGVIGVGHVGTKVASLCRLLGMHVLLNDPPRERQEGGASFVPLGAILEHADIISFHVPLNRSGPDRTLHLADDRLLSRLRPDQVLLNTSRGEVVDTAALKSLLGKKGLAGCVLDVWEQEPSIDRTLLNMTTLGTPHIAGYSADGKANGTAMIVQALSRQFELPLDRWYPPAVPPPAQPRLRIDGHGLSRLDILARAILHTYTLADDDSALRHDPGSFEQLRAGYPVRREFPAHTVSVRDVPAPVQECLAGMGFHLLQH